MTEDKMINPLKEFDALIKSGEKFMISFVNKIIELRNENKKLKLENAKLQNQVDSFLFEKLMSKEEEK